MRLLAAVHRYPLVAATLGVAALAGILSLTGWRPAVPWLVSGFAVLIAARSFVSMLRDVIRGHAGVDVLAVLAIGAAVAVGEYWAALVIVLMLTGGEALEDFAENKAKRDLTDLLERAPQTAHRLHPDGTVQDIPVDEVAVGDELVVKAAELVPVDGVLVSGGVFDESGLTGESLPVERAPGDPVLSGVVNGETAVQLRATAIAADSQYAGIIALVQQASASRSRVVRLADRFAVPFTLVALVIAGVAWWASGDATRFAEVLVVATPCPLIIAAPVAYLGGMSRAAKASIIVKNASTLEQLAAAKAVGFDKTGTLTRGEPVLDRFEPAGGFDRERALLLAASAEQYSGHVLAAAVADSVRSAGVTLLASDDVDEVATNGVRARLDGSEVVVGKRAFVEAEVGAAIPVPHLESGEQVAFVGIDGRYAGALYLRDEVRDNARATVDELRALGIGRVLMLTGDAEATARHVAAGLGIDEVHADLLPADKVRIVRALPQRPVIMAGDGINDAPVLAAAEVGIAMGARGATAASESADAVLLVDDVAGVATAVRIGRDTTRIALQSIIGGIVLSIGLMLVAAFGLIPAIVGAWLQEAVDLVVILAALRALGPRRGRQRVVPGEAVSGW